MKILKQISTTLISGAITAIIPILTISNGALAANCQINSGIVGADNCAKNAAVANGAPTTLFGNGTTGIFTQAINVMLFAVGILSVIMLIFGGLRYIISNGDSKKVDAAKNTILYAIIGLVIALLSYAIVNFVISYFVQGGGGSGGGEGVNGVSPTNV